MFVLSFCLCRGGYAFQVKDTATNQDAAQSKPQPSKLVWRAFDLPHFAGKQIKDPEAANGVAWTTDTEMALLEGLKLPSAGGYQLLCRIKPHSSLRPNSIQIEVWGQQPDGKRSPLASRKNKAFLDTDGWVVQPMMGTEKNEKDVDFNNLDLRGLNGQIESSRLHSPDATVIAIVSPSTLKAFLAGTFPVTGACLAHEQASKHIYQVLLSNIYYVLRVAPVSERRDPDALQDPLVRLLYEAEPSIPDDLHYAIGRMGVKKLENPHVPPRLLKNLKTSFNSLCSKVPPAPDVNYDICRESEGGND